MANLIVILLCLGAGMGLRRMGRITRDGTRALNAYVLYVAVPALVILHVPDALRQARWGLRTLAPVSVAWLCLSLSWLTIHAAATRLRLSRGTLGAMVLTAGLGNTAFLGYPLLAWLVGPEALTTAVLVDQPGSFLVISTYAIVVAAFYGGAKLEARALARRLFTFPPLLAMLVAAGLSATRAALPTLAHETLEKLSLTLVPTSLVSVGAALRADDTPWRTLLQRNATRLAAVLALKLIAWPLVMLVFYHYLLGLNGVVARVTVLDAGMAPMVTTAMLVAEFELDSELANLAVAAGVPCSLVTVPVWDAVLRRVMG